MELFIGSLVVAGILYGLSRSHARASGQRRQGGDARVSDAARAASPRRLTAPEQRAIRARHSAVWWLAELMHGFPVHRTGFHQHWLAHAAAAEQVRGHRDAVRDERDSFREARAAYRKAREEARQQVQDAMDASGVGQDGSRAAVREAAGDAVVLPFRPRATVPQEAPGPAVCGRCGKGASCMCLPWTEPAPRPVPCDACGNPETAADPLVTADEWHVHQSHTTDPADGFYRPPATQGEPMASDTTYTSVQRAAAALAAHAETDVATIGNRIVAATAMADQMQAHDVDSGSLSEVLDLIDRMKAAQEALRAVGEQTAMFSGNLGRRHKNLDDAHAEAPVPAAQRDFYTGQ